MIVWEAQIVLHSAVPSKLTYLAVQSSHCTDKSDLRTSLLFLQCLTINNKSNSQNIFAQKEIKLFQPPDKNFYSLKQSTIIATDISLEDSSQGKVVLIECEVILSLQIS